MGIVETLYQNPALLQTTFFIMRYWKTTRVTVSESAEVPTHKKKSRFNSAEICSENENVRAYVRMCVCVRQGQGQGLMARVDGKG